MKRLHPHPEVRNSRPASVSRSCRFQQAGILILLAVIMLSLSGCLGLITPTTWADGTDGTDWTDATQTTSSAGNPQDTSMSASESEQTTPPGSFDRDFLQDVDAYGTLTSDQTVRLPGGQWYDLSDSGQWTNLANLLVEAAGTGQPTLSRYGETQPVLVLDSCSSLTFRNIRFGHNEKTRGEGNEANELPLVMLLNCQGITFENCSFFGGSDAGIILDGSEQVSLVDCEFYSLDGQPVKTGASYKPSQLLADACTFETGGSGPMMLNVRDSRFEACDWIGTNGYSMPVYNTSQDPRILAEKIWSADSLPYRLDHVLAARVDYHRDSNQAITLIDNFFCSSEVTDLYDQTDRILARLLGKSLTSWSLTGEKEEEAESGAPLDPTLGLQIQLRAATPMVPVVVTPAPTEPPAPTETLAPADASETGATTDSDDPAATDGSDDPGETSSAGETTSQGDMTSQGNNTSQGDAALASETTLPIETTAPTEQMWRPVYTLVNLVQDLMPLRDLRSKIDSLITGTIRLDVANQALLPLLTCSMPIGNLGEALADPLGTALLDVSQMVILNDQIIPADFFADPAYGSQTANDSNRLLTTALHIQGIPCALHPSADQTCFIEHILVYQGTRLVEGTALHRFDVRVERGESGTEGVDRGDFLFAQLDVRADTGIMTDWLDGTTVGRMCSLPLVAQKALILDLLRQSGTIQVYRAPDANGGKSGILQVQALTDLIEHGANYVPILIFTTTERRIEAKVALYDEAYRVYPVLLVLMKPGESWQIQSADVILEPDPVG